jgi:hypothetical protein
VGVEVQNCFKGDLVLGQIKISPFEDLDDISNSVFAQQHSTESALLGQHVVRRGAISTVIALRR